MRKRFLLLAPALGLLLLGAGLAHATGFSIYEASARATALGCAFTATADDGSALFYNAAGLSFQTGRSLGLNTVAVAPQFKFAGHLTQGDALQRGESENKVFLVPGAYYTARPTDKLAYGVGMYAPFGLGVVWKDGAEWVGRRVSHDVSIQTVYVTPAVSYMVGEGCALALGADVATQYLSLSKFTPEPQFGTNALESKISGRSKPNVTPTVGFMLRPSPRVSVGAMYHFGKTMKFENRDATLTNVQAAGDTWAAALLTGLGGSNQTVSSELNLPSMMSLGLALTDRTGKIRVEGDYVRFGWHTFSELALDFTNDALDQTIHFDYEDSWQARFGAEYTVNDDLRLQFGYVRDKTPQPLKAVSPLLPDSDRNDYSFGFNYKKGTWDLSASYMAVVGSARTNIQDGEPLRNTTDYPFGTYKSVANLYAVGVRHNF